MEKIKGINKRGGWIFFCGWWNFSKSVRVGPTFIREMRVLTMQGLKYGRNQYIIESDLIVKVLLPHKD